jgi:hypothetical protein
MIKIKQIEFIETRHCVNNSGWTNWCSVSPVGTINFRKWDTSSDILMTCEGLPKKLVDMLYETVYDWDDIESKILSAKSAYAMFVISAFIEYSYAEIDRGV